MKKKRKWIIAVIIVLIVALGSVYSIPKLRVSLFVHSYHELIEDGLAAGNGVPADDAVLFGYDYVNSWEGTHPMTEFVIMSYGNTYYGCYYSPDDVPLAFQNADVEVTQDGHDYWEWEAEGDNHGSTSKIMEQWYFFKASF
ncbi:MAG: hypothetical protein IJN02_08675 [Bacteroidales bacterium]|nr:hypothetical protein [Bacteroidaceae bacterium]MBQ6689293.1 hypothetical protein [Bacteroidales bacterium]